jgi:hypothetical protein
MFLLELAYARNSVKCWWKLKLSTCPPAGRMVAVVQLSVQSHPSRPMPSTKLAYARNSSRGSLLCRAIDATRVGLPAALPRTRRPPPPCHCRSTAYAGLLLLRCRHRGKIETIYVGIFYYVCSSIETMYVGNVDRSSRSK